MARIAILHPGEMGAAVGGCLVQAGHDVVWVAAGRSPASRRRADAAGLRAVESLGGCDVVLSICPPAAAVDTARALGRFRGVYVDANAISPRTADTVADLVAAGGADFVDGSVIGPPPRQAGTTRLYLAGPRAAEVAGLFRGSRLAAPVLDVPGRSASALKMTYGAWTKIGAALLLAARATAEQQGVGAALDAEWLLSQPELPGRLAQAVAAATAKGWRWDDEMRQIAETFAEAGQPAGFGDAAAEMFGRYPRP